MMNIRVDSIEELQDILLDLQIQEEIHESNPPVASTSLNLLDFLTGTLASKSISISKPTMPAQYSLHGGIPVAVIVGLGVISWTTQLSTHPHPPSPTNR